MLEEKKPSSCADVLNEIKLVHKEIEIMGKKLRNGTTTR